MASIAGRRRRRSRPDFVARTIVGVTEAIERTVYTEEHARRPGLLQRADPRVKVVLFALAVLTVGLARTLPVLLALYVAIVGLGLWSGFSPGFFVKRVLLGIPLFAGIVAVPALFLIGGAPLVRIPLGVGQLTISDNAALSFLIFVTRVAASVTLAVLLVVTTRWADLLKALRVFHAPEIFIIVLGMTYRYIFLFLQMVENLFLARASRTVGEPQAGEQRRWIGTGMGTLMSRSLQTSTNVYQAMVARGFNGDVRTITDFRMRDEDWLLASSGIVLLAIALIADIGLR